MTAPNEPEDPSEQTPPPPPPPSPEVAAVEETLDQAEQSMVPIITTAILAALATSAVAGNDEDDTNLGIIAKGALFPVYTILETAARGLTETIRGMLLMVLHPLILRILIANDPTGRIPADELRRTATDAANRAIDLAASGLNSYSTTHRSSYTTTDIYSMFTSRRSSTTTSVTTTTQQRKVEYFSVRLSRWLAREALFGAQERIADRLGYTHKRWISERDNRVRAEHRYLDGMVVPINALFVTATGSIRYPGDVSAPPHLVINCRCTLEWIKRP